MFKFSIIGFGGHVRKNILPAIGRSKNFHIDNIYVRDFDKYKDICSQYDLNCSLLNEITASNSKWFYISTPISSHYELVKECLLMEKNVICEKPLTISKAEAIDLFNIADKKKVVLYEVDMYKHHLLYENLRKITKENLKNIKSLSVKFSIPHLKADDIRYNHDLGGGALRDVGYYPISLITSLFNSPLKISSSIFSEKDYNVDLSGSAMLTYDNFYCTAEWGIGLPYSNRAILVTEDSEIFFERIFSKPNDLETIVTTKRGSAISHKNISKDDQFLNMFTYISKSSKENFKHNREVSILIHDLMDKIKENLPSHS